MPQLNPTAEADAWTWQVQAMADLAAFLRDHGPDSRAPLAAVPWAFGQGWTVTAEVSAQCNEPDPGVRAIVALHAINVLNDYAEALGTEVEVHRGEGRMPNVCLVQGRIGPVGTDGQPRTVLVLTTTVHRGETLEVAR